MLIESWLAAFLLAQLVLLPVQGLIWLGIRRERRDKERLLAESLRALRMIGVSRGRHLR